MNRIKLFEDFSTESKYLWPEAMAWMEDLHPEEICFLTLYTSIIEYKNSSRYSSVKEKCLFPIKTDNRSYDLEDDDGDGICSFELTYEIPSRDNKECSLSFEAVGRGHFTEFIRGGYMEPDEGGDPILDSVDFEYIYYLDSDQDTEIDFLNNSYVFKSDIITRKDLFNIMEYAAAERIEAEDNTETTKPELPQKLMDKCEDIRKNYPDVVKGSNLLNRFGSMGTK